MITELAEIRLKDGTSSNFELAFAEAAQLLRSAEGCLGVKLLHGVETDVSYRLVVDWVEVKAHTERFVSSESFKKFISFIDPFFAKEPTVEHFTEVGTW